ncbi:MAG: hypothetical protein ACO1NW_19155 [Chitinophagaceae bacterium]
MLFRKKGVRIFFVAAMVCVILIVLFRNPLLLKYQLWKLEQHHWNADKVWVHRVNTPERLNTLYSHFTGFELDVVFDTGADNIAVAHPPTLPAGFTLENALQRDTSKSKKWWIDVKEMDTVNYPVLVAELKKLLVNRSAIVETADTLLLKLLKKEALVTAFNCSAGKPVLRKENTAFIRRNADYVSCDEKDILFVRNLFPGHPKLIWALRFSYFLPGNKMTSLFSEKDYEVVLMNIKSDHYR